MIIKNLTFKYYENSKKIVLDNLNFQVEKGKISLLVGKSGSGKSTLSYIMSGLYPKNTGVLLNGEILFEEMDIQKSVPDERVIIVSMMFQNPNLQFCMSTLREEIIFCLENIKLSKEEIDDRIEEVLKIIDVEKYLDRKLQTLSGGEKQICALACIISMKTKFLILDEPFANIDSEYTKFLMKALVKLNKEKKITLFIVDHMIEKWLDVIDDIYLLKDGKEIEVIEIKNNFQNNKEKILERLKIEGLIFSKENFITNENCNEDIIHFKNVTVKKENENLIENINLKIKKGSMVAFLGKSGCGKTTLFKTMFGLNEFSGQIFIDNVEVLKKNRNKIYEKIGIVLQNPENQFISQNVLDEVVGNQKKDEKNIEKALLLLKSFNLKIYQKYSPFMLSQGQQRRLAILSMVFQGQKILILDEPTYGQDGETTKAIMELLNKKRQDEELTVIFSTHDENVAKQYADKIYTVYNKNIIEGRCENEKVPL